VRGRVGSSSENKLEITKKTPPEAREFGELVSHLPEPPRGREQRSAGIGTVAGGWLLVTGYWLLVPDTSFQ